TELARRRAVRAELERALGPTLEGGCCDDLYRSALVLADAAAADGAAEPFAALSRLTERRGEPATLPIVLTRTAWRVWSRLPYLESPLRFLEAAGDGDDGLVAAGSPLPGVWQYRWGAAAPASAPAPDALVLALGRESLATLRLTWRWQVSGASPLSPAYALHYALSRTLSLRLLLERGVAAPAFALDPLRARFAAEFPDEADALARLQARLEESDGPAPWTELYDWTDAQLRRAAEAGR
ncbi:MAG: hypothetical protein KGM24_04310, partial [Elusimicrobia bacterium]|nr:hypothetical protein [Elusimicrobiota bacterium]